MRAIVLDSTGVAFQPDYPLPDPMHGEVLVRVVRAGVCETDLQLVRGYMGFRGVLGHEFVGVAQDGPLEGERVVSEINCSCWKCELCRSGLANHCPNRTVLGILNHDGAFADYICVPARNLHWVPDEVSTDEAVFVEPLAAAFQIPAQVRLESGQRVTVLGDGRLGNLCAQVIQLFGCNVTVIGKYAKKLELLGKLGIKTCLLDNVQPQRDADIVVDCTGSVTGLTAAVRFVRPRGTVVLKTTVVDELTLSMAPFVIDEIQLVGSRCGPFAEALDALKSKRIDVTPLISARFPLPQGPHAIETASTSSVLKVLLDIEED